MTPLSDLRPLLLTATAMLLSATQVLSQSAPLKRGSIELTIGGVNDDRAPYLFSDVRGLTLDGEGRVFVAEAADNQIRVYSFSGEHLFSFGGAGAGPGDLSRPCCLAFSSGDSLWVKEQGNHRYSLYKVGRVSAEFLHSIASAANPTGEFYPVQWDSRGRLLDIGRAQLPPPDEGAYVRYVLTANRTFTPRDTFPDAPLSTLGQVKLYNCPTGAPGRACATTIVGPPYGPRSLHAFGPGGWVASVITSSYSVRLVGPSGSVIAELRSASAGVPLTSVERRRAEEMLDRMASSTKRSRSALGFVVPKMRPAVRALFFDLEGRLWVARTVAAKAEQSADIYDAGGSLVARMRWPHDVDLSLGAIRGDTALGQRLDAEGNLAVVRVVFRSVK